MNCRFEFSNPNLSGAPAFITSIPRLHNSFLHHVAQFSILSPAAAGSPPAAAEAAATAAAAAGAPVNAAAAVAAATAVAAVAASTLAAAAGLRRNPDKNLSFKRD